MHDVSKIADEISRDSKAWLQEEGFLQLEKDINDTHMYTRKADVKTDKILGEDNPEINDVRISWVKQFKAGGKIQVLAQQIPLKDKWTFQNIYKTHQTESYSIYSIIRALDSVIEAAFEKIKQNM